MATQQQRITELAQAIASDIKLLTTNQGTLTALTTKDKTSLVNAINELKTAIADTTNTATQTNNSVRVDAPQTFTVAEKAQGCANLGIGNPDTDFTAAYNAAKA